jgi:hypothetical protein
MSHQRFDGPACIDGKVESLSHLITFGYDVIRGHNKQKTVNKIEREVQFETLKRYRDVLLQFLIAYVISEEQQN